MGKQYNAMNEEEFKRLKMVLDAGLSVGQAHKFTGRGLSTLFYINQSDSFADYKAKVRAKNLVRKPTATPTKFSNVPAEQQTAPANLIEVLSEVRNALRDLAQAYNNNSEKLDEVLETKRPWISRLK